MEKTELCIGGKRRIRWVDAARGIGIILVTLIHSSTSAIRNYNFGVYLLYHFTVLVAVPIMTFLAGYSFQLCRDKYIKMRTEEFVKKKFRSLIMPYLSYALIIYTLFVLAGRMPKIGSLVARAGYSGIGIKDFLVGLLIGHNRYSIHLWFLYVLFVYEMIAFFVAKYIKKDFLLIIIAAIMLVYSFFFYPDFSLAWGNGLAYFVFFTMGILKRKDYRITIIYISTVLWIVLFLTRFFFLSPHLVIYNILGTVIPVFACISVAGLSHLINDSVKGRLIYLGQNSMAIYLFQQPFFGSALGTILYAVIGIPAWITVAICFIMSIGVPMVIRRIFVRFNWFKLMFAIK
ncbi:acyltransferase family protein [Butyrivibrio sp. JL13D10]|uniref:acyltransferase family protein n=1 Tax=Butyrivibrio sp. JL13D10 TaxID=3236815 RepID=UPI0038B43972